MERKNGCCLKERLPDKRIFIRKMIGFMAKNKASANNITCRFVLFETDLHYYDPDTIT